MEEEILIPVLIGITQWTNTQLIWHTRCTEDQIYQNKIGWTHNNMIVQC